MSKVIGEKFVKTRKPHTCFGCGKSFDTEELIKSFVQDGCNTKEEYLCQSCHKMFYNLGHWDEGEIYEKS